MSILAWRVAWTVESMEVSLMAQLVKNQPAMWETWVQSLGWEDGLEKGMATPLSMGWQRVGHT